MPAFITRMVPLAAALALLVAVAPAHAATTSFGKLARAVTVAKPSLGARTAADLGRRVSRARVDYRRGRRCASLKTLGTVVERASKRPGGAVVAKRARALQRRIFLRTEARHGRCGLKAPTFRVSAGLKPDPATVESAGVSRPVVRVAGPHATTDFIADELVVEGSADLAARFAARWHGRVVKTVALAGAPAYHLVRVDPSGAGLGHFAADLERLEPAATGAFRVSSGRALRLLAIAADAAAHGLKVAPNAVTEGTSILSSATAEAPEVKDVTPGNWNPDAYSWWYTNALGVGDAWRALELSGKSANRVKLAVLDNGFASDAATDLRNGATGMDDLPNGHHCSQDSWCPWHGTGVASAAAAVIDNGSGAAGTGGQVATAMMIHNGTSSFSLMDAVYEALDRGAKVISISSGMEIDAVLGFVNLPYEDSTQTAREQGAIVVGAAGNDNRDVDAEDCFVFCWEEEKIVPCENDGVTCVGSIDADGRRSSFSNFGKESCGNAQECDVDIFAPGTVWVGPDPDEPQPHEVSGTSISTPFVSGVVAMLFAAHPDANAGAIEGVLLDGAEPSGDISVSRVVHAMHALERVLPSIPPKVEIDKPANLDVPYGGFGTTLKAKVFSLGSCGGCKVTWSSDKDGALGNGASVEVAFPTPGEREVTATVTDPAGPTATDHVELNATNTAPVATIDTPDYPYGYFVGKPFKAKGHGSDANELGDLPCASLSWTVNDQPAGTGCAPTLTLPTIGFNDIGLKVVDAHGLTATTTTKAIADIVAPNTPPFVTITSPDRDDNLDHDTPVTLSAIATDPDTGTPVTGTWSVRVNGVTTPIGPGNTRSWTPGNDVPFSCGGAHATLVFSATDADGTSTDEIPVKVAYGTC